MPSSRNSSTKDGFSALGLSEALVTALTVLGYEEPTPVQRETIPLLLTGRDLVAQAATGTGKTAAFALPMIQRLTAAQAHGRHEGKAPRADDARWSSVSRRAAGIHEERPRLTGRRKAAASPVDTPGQVAGMVLVPTRELAMQVCEAIHKYARSTSLTVVPLYGGASMEQQIRALGRGVDIVVATPGRALDHVRRKTLRLDAVRLLVLDEADEMLDMGFAEDLEAIFSETPESRQTALFSATLPARILKIAERHLEKPERVTVAREKTAAGKLPRIRQVAYVVRRGDKPAALDRILDMENPTSAIVFCRTRLEVDTLVDTLNAHGYRAEALHGGMQQRQRDAVMTRVRSNKTDLLIATDVAARGLDIEHVSHVVNYDLPTDAESYVHRIGRTGRAGRDGTAITLAEPREHRLLRTIEHLTKQKIEVATVPTLADLRARRLELTSATLRAQLAAGDFDDVRVVVESLAGDFDVLDIAAAAVKMAHTATAGDGDEREIAVPAPRERSGAYVGPARGSRPVETGFARLFVGAGRAVGIRPADLVGAIAGEANVPSKAIGAIRIAENFSVVDVPEELADGIIASMRGASLRGRKVVVRRDRDVA
jgi:ATP-dependent RNA helicase DeaD